MTDPRLVAQLYQESKGRIVALLDESGVAGWRAAVPACPGWTVGDVVAHLTAVADEWATGRISGPPTDAQTAAQIRRFGDLDPSALCAEWTAAATRLARHAAATGVEPPVGDVVSHEHDIRGALGRPGARGSSAVWYTSDRLLTNLRTPVPLRVTVEDGQYRSGPPDGAEIGLRTDRFEALRWRTGRRSRAQLGALDWSADPTAVLDHLCMFGPAEADLTE